MVIPVKILLIKDIQAFRNANNLLGENYLEDLEHTSWKIPNLRKEAINVCKVREVVRLKPQIGHRWRNARKRERIYKFKGKYFRLSLI